MQTQHLYVIQVDDNFYRMIYQIKEHEGVSPSCSFSSVIRYIIQQYHQELEKQSTPSLSNAFHRFRGKRQNIRLYEEDIQRLMDIKRYHQWSLKESISMTVQKVVTLYLECIQNKPAQPTFQQLKTPNQISDQQRRQLSEQIHQLRLSQGLTLEEWGKKYGVSTAGAWYWEHGGRPREMILNKMKVQYEEINNEREC